MIHIRPDGATHTDGNGSYYKPGVELNWYRWNAELGNWFICGTMPAGSLTPLPHVQVVELKKFDAPQAPTDQPELTEAKRLLLKLFKANDNCSEVPEFTDPAVSQWPGSPMRTEIETFLGLKPVDPVEAQLQRDELLYGNSYALRNADGTVTRLDPTLIVIRQRKL